MHDEACKIAFAYFKYNIGDLVKPIVAEKARKGYDGFISGQVVERNIVQLANGTFLACYVLRLSNGDSVATSLVTFTEFELELEDK